MSDAYWNAFFELHRDLPREGPGSPDDVTWAAQTAGLPYTARILDVACGPGADIGPLLAAAPQGHVTAVDKVDHFVAQAQAVHGADPRTTIYAGDMAEVEGPFDFIWCAGAVYFLGVTEALKLWRGKLAPGGSIAFSQICWFTESPSEAAKAGWAEYPAMTNEAGLQDLITQAGYRCLATRRVSDAGWEDYFGPIDARIAALRPTAQSPLTDVLDEAEAEAALWRAERDAFGYQICVVTPT